VAASADGGYPENVLRKGSGLPGRQAPAAGIRRADALGFHVLAMDAQRDDENDDAVRGV
jgi:hypothetical protein